MTPKNFILISIYSIAVCCWLRYFYLHSLKKKADRTYLLQRLYALFDLIPLGFQAVYLLCFSMGLLLSVVLKGFGLFDSPEHMNGLDKLSAAPVRIIMAAAYLITIQYLIRLWLPQQFGLRVLYFLVSLFFFNVLVRNSMPFLNIETDAVFPTIFHSTALFVSLLMLTVILLLLSNKWGRTRMLKHITLTAKLLSLFLLFYFLLNLPSLLLNRAIV